MNIESVAEKIADALFHDDAAETEASSLIMESPTGARWCSEHLKEAVSCILMREAGITREQLNILQHALGLHEGKDYRNYYVAEDGQQDCETLVKAGYMTKGHGVPGYDKISWNLMYYFVTETGKKVAYANLLPEKKTTRAQRRYQAFLEADSGLPFMVWARSKYGKAVK